MSEQRDQTSTPLTSVQLDELPITDTEVLVVGAGPTGLMAALVLARRGVPTITLDAKAAPTVESRALAVQARTMEIYDQLGLAEQVLDNSYPALRMQIGRQGGRRGLNFAGTQQGATPYPGIQIFDQSQNEELLSRTLEETGQGVQWQHRLITLDENPDRPNTDEDPRPNTDEGPRPDAVVALVEGPSGLTRIRARWCVGADGAGSAVRRRLDLPFEGVTDDAAFYVADLRGVAGLPDNSLATRFGDRTFAVFFPLGPDGHARMISMAPGATASQEDALARSRADLGISYTAVDWFSTYRVHHRVAARFRKESVFLAGDAAHVHSPIGGQGMNTGLQDAHNLANLLADVATGQRESSALDCYERERRPVALHLVRATDRAFGVIARPDRTTAWFRRRFSRVMAVMAPRVLRSQLGSRLGGWLGQYRIRYHFADRRTPPVWAQDRAVGLRLPPAGSNLLALRSFTWQLHTYGADLARSEVPDWVEGPHDFGADPSAVLRADRAYLIRPDGFVAASLPIHGGVVDQPGLAAALSAHQLIN